MLAGHSMYRHSAKGFCSGRGFGRLISVAAQLHVNLHTSTFACALLAKSTTDQTLATRRACSAIPHSPNPQKHMWRRLKRKRRHAYQHCVSVPATPRHRLPLRALHVQGLRP